MLLAGFITWRAYRRTARLNGLAEMKYGRAYHGPIKPLPPVKIPIKFRTKPPAGPIVSPPPFIQNKELKS